MSICFQGFSEWPLIGFIPGKCDHATEGNDEDYESADSLDDDSIASSNPGEKDNPGDKKQDEEESSDDEDDSEDDE